MDHRIIWRRLDQPGHEAARLSVEKDEWVLEGASIFVEDGVACYIDYAIRCDHQWRFKHASVKGWIGDKDVDLAIAVEDGRWTVNGEIIRGLDGCIDLDLNFSPSTNTLPIRRLQLEIDEKALVSAAWLRFPSLDLVRLDQTYVRTGELAYAYETADGKFKRELIVNGEGLVTKYPGLWGVQTTG